MWKRANAPEQEIARDRRTGGRALTRTNTYADTHGDSGLKKMPRDRSLFARPPGATALGMEALEASSAEARRDDMHMLSSDRFQSRLEQEQKRRRFKRRAAMERVTAETEARGTMQYRLNVKAADIGKNDPEFNYFRGLMPGDLLFQFFAPRPRLSPESREEIRPTSSGRRLRRPRELARGGKASNQHPRKVDPKRLQIWMPDTVVYCGRDGPMWLYSHSDGYVYRSHMFDSRELLRRVGNSKFPDDVVAVRKESVFMPVDEAAASGGIAGGTTSLAGGGAAEDGLLNNDGGGGDSPTPAQAFSFDGNQSRVVSTRELDDIVTQMGSANDDKVFAIQRYIKCSGPQAFMIRSVLQRGKQPYAWMVSNRAHFDDNWGGDEQATVSSLSELASGSAGPNGVAGSGAVSTLAGESARAKKSVSSAALTARYCTDMHTTGACTFAHLRGRAAAPSANLNMRILKYLERAIGRPIETMAADFIRDAHGDLWFLQVKAFRFAILSPPRPLALSRASRNAFLHSQGGRTELSETLQHLQKRAELRHFRNGEHGGSKLSAYHDGQSTEPVALRRREQVVHRMARCRFCMIHHLPDELPFTMTRKMIQDTEQHLQARVGVARFQRLFGGRDTVAFASAKSALYQPYHVCKLCYALYQSEMKLKQVSGKFATILCTNAATGLFAESSANLTSSSGARMTKSAVAAHNRAKSHGVGRKALRGVFGNQMNDLLTSVRTDRFLNDSAVALYRMIIVFHAVHDLPEAIFEENAAAIGGDEEFGSGGSGGVRSGRRHEYFLRYNMCGHIVELDLDIDSAVDNVVPIRALRMHYMFTRDGDIAGNVTGGLNVHRPQGARKREGTRRSSGGTSLVRGGGRGLSGSRRIDKFISSCEFIHVKLLRCLSSHDSSPPLRQMNTSGGRVSRSSSERPPRWHAKELGEAKLPLKQFKSSFVNKHDVFAPMGLELGMCSLRATIGLELTRSDVNSAVLLSDPGLREVHSVYVPSPGFRTTDPLPRDWFEVLREPPFNGSLLQNPASEQIWQQPRGYDRKLLAGNHKNNVHASGEFLAEGKLKGEKEERAAVVAATAPSSAAASALSDAEPIWHITLQVHSLHNIPGAAGTTDNDESLFCLYSFLGKQVRSRAVRATLSTRENEGKDEGEGDERKVPADVQILHTENLYLQCTWVKLQSYFRDNPTLQIDVHRLSDDGANAKVSAAEHVDDAPVFSSYINLEDFASLKTIDGTYDMICIGNNSSRAETGESITAKPPYLAASLYLVPVDPEVPAEAEDEDEERRRVGLRVRRLPNAAREQSF